MRHVTYSIANNAREWWKGIKANKPEPMIFWEFIEKERNLILKEATFRAGQSVAVTLPAACKPAQQLQEKNLI